MVLSGFSVWVSAFGADTPFTFVDFSCRSRSLGDGLRFWIAAYWFLFGGIGVFLLLESSEFTLILTSCVNQLQDLTYLLSACVGITPNPLPSVNQLNKWTGISVLIGGSSLIVSGLLLELFETLGGDVQQQGLVDLIHGKCREVCDASGRAGKL